MKYHLITRTPDNSDGIYSEVGRQVISARELERRGYSEHYLLGCTDQELARIARVFEVEMSQRKEQSSNG